MLPTTQALSFEHPPALIGNAPPPQANPNDPPMPVLAEITQYEQHANVRLQGLRNYTQVHPLVDVLLGSERMKQVAMIIVGIYAAVKTLINGSTEVRILISVTIVLFATSFLARAFNTFKQTAKKDIDAFHTHQQQEFAASMQVLGFLELSETMANECLNGVNEVEPRLTNYTHFIENMDNYAAQHPGAVDQRISTLWKAMKPHIEGMMDQQTYATMQRESTFLLNATLHSKHHQQRLAHRAYILASPYWSDWVKKQLDRIGCCFSCCLPQQQVAPNDANV